MKTTINVDNLKCGGCTNTIKHGLMTIKNVNKTVVNPDKGTVEVDYDDENALANVKVKLKEMGYPESGSVSGFEKVTTNAKSYVSCAIGKFTKEEEK